MEGYAWNGKMKEIHGVWEGRASESYIYCNMKHYFAWPQKIANEEKEAG